MCRKLFQLLILYILSVSYVYSANFLVNDSGDLTDANVGDGICETAAGNGLCSLRAAIEESNSNADVDSINIDNSVALITLSSPLSITSSLAIIAGVNKTTLDGNNATNIMTVSNGPVVHLENLDLINGIGTDLSGGIDSNADTLKLINCNLTNNTSDGNGGAVGQFRGTLYIDNSRFEGNFVNSIYLGGGAIYFSGESAVIRNSQFVGNQATVTFNQFLNRPQGGGAIYSFGETLIEGSQFDQNSTNLEGGAAILRKTTVVLNSQFDKNSAMTNGGTFGLYPINYQLVSMENVDITGSNSARNGGGIYISDEYDSGTQVTFFSNNLRITSSTDNTPTSAALAGGGIYVESSRFSCTNCLLYIRNSLIRAAEAPIGSAFYFNGGHLFDSLLENSTVIQNGANSNSAIYIPSTFRTTLKINNSTIAENGGDGIRAEATTDAYLEINNSTIVNNTGINVNRTNSGSFVYLENSLLFNNIGTNCNMAIFSRDGNALNSVCGTTDHTNDTVDVNMTMPGLVPPNLNNINGYYPIAVGHPAIGVANSSSCFAIDQRYFARGANCDAGAFQADGTLIDHGNISFVSPQGSGTASYSVDEFDQSLAIPINRSAAGNLNTEVEVTFFSIEATRGSSANYDYTSSQSNLSWSANTGDNQALNISIVDSYLDREPEERFLVVLHGATNGAKIGANRIATVTITDNIPRPGELHFANPSETVVEDSGLYVPLVIRRSNGVDGSGVVRLNLVNDSATWGTDFDMSLDGQNNLTVGDPIEVTFDQGETEKTVYVHAIDNSDFTGDRQFTINLEMLADPVTNIVLANNNVSLQVIVKDDEIAGELSFQGTGLEVAENDGVLKDISFQRTGNIPVTVTISSSGAEAGVDFLLYQNDGVTEIPSTNGVFELAVAADQAGSFKFKAVDDQLIEGNKSLILTVTNLSQGTIGAQNTFQIDITEDDTGGTVRFSPDSYSVSENASVNITIVRENGTAGGASVDVVAVGGNADNADYQLSSEQVTFAVGETSKTIRLSAIKDNSNEGNETLVLGLANANGLTIAGGEAQVTISEEKKDKGSLSLFLLLFLTLLLGIRGNKGRIQKI